LILNDGAHESDVSTLKCCWILVAHVVPCGIQSFRGYPYVSSSPRLLVVKVGITGGQWSRIHASSSTGRRLGCSLVEQALWSRPPTRWVKSTQPERKIYTYTCPVSIAQVKETDLVSPVGPIDRLSLSLSALATSRPGRTAAWFEHKADRVKKILESPCRHQSVSRIAPCLFQVTSSLTVEPPLSIMAWPTKAEPKAASFFH
jgi:hypothetical protein